MEFKGTPGPWINVGGWVNAVDNGIICSLSAVSMKPEDIDDANANLIAAAPEMLDALIKIVKMNQQYAIDKYGDVRKAEEIACVRTARAAINKALGRE